MDVESGCSPSKKIDAQHRSNDQQRFEGVVEFFEITDLDGNKIGFATELS